MSFMRPKFTTLYEEIGMRIDKFYQHGSVLTENKYIVGLSGDYVKAAVDSMRRKAGEPHAYTGRNGRQIIPQNTYAKMFKRWEDLFAPEREDVELRWTASNVVIPMLKNRTMKTFSMDSTKTIWYPIVTGCQDTDKIILTIVEERGMGMFQFFNALMNQFYTTKMLKPKSSFQKLGMYIIVLNGEYIVSSSGNKLSDAESNKFKNDNDHSAIGGILSRPLVIPYKTESITDIPLQLFEFNSIVPIGIDQITVKEGEANGLITFRVEFEAPNIFQDTYNSVSLQGLMDNTTDEQYMAAGKYSDKMFTTTTLNSKENTGSDP